MCHNRIRVLSLGAGVQSTTVFLMSCLGELPKLDHAVFADTGWEPAAVYKHLDWLKSQGRRYGIPIDTVTVGNMRSISLRAQVGRCKKEHFASMPLYVQGPDGNSGMIRRQCTSEYKIRPINRYLRRVVLGLRHRTRAPRHQVIDQWFGISFDELRRMRDSRLPFVRNVYPLVGMPVAYLSKTMTRQDCRAWLADRFPDRRVARSACIGCPYHSQAEWRDMKDNRPDEWSDAVDFDRAIRKLDRMGGDVFLHRSRVPLEQVDLDTPEDRGQLNMFDDECEGLCGV